MPSISGMENRGSQPVGDQGHKGRRASTRKRNIGSGSHGSRAKGKANGEDRNRGRVRQSDRGRRMARGDHTKRMHREIIFTDGPGADADVGFKCVFQKAEGILRHPEQKEN